MKSLYDYGFEAALAGFQPDTMDLGQTEMALYLEGFDEGQRVRELLETQ